jgi:hypothetical protein
MTGARLSIPKGFREDSLGAEGGGAAPTGSIEDILCLYGGALPRRGPEGIFGGKERSTAGGADGFCSGKGSSLLGLTSDD